MSKTIKKVVKFNIDDGEIKSADFNINATIKDFKTMLKGLYGDKNYILYKKIE